MSEFITVLGDEYSVASFITKHQWIALVWGRLWVLRGCESGTLPEERRDSPAWQEAPAEASSTPGKALLLAKEDGDWKSDPFSSVGING